jgi:hypothetical protein
MVGFWFALGGSVFKFLLAAMLIDMGVGFSVSARLVIRKDAKMSERGLPGERDRRRLSATEEEIRTVRHAMVTGGYVFDYKGWDVRWTGWRLPINKITEFGAWIATHPKVPGYYYSVTRGATAYQEDLFGMMITDTAQSGSWVYQSQPEREKAAVDAFASLLRILDTVPSPDV